MTQELDTLLQQALKLDAVDRAKLIDALARSLDEEAGIDPDAPITPGPLLEAGTVAALVRNDKLDFLFSVVKAEQNQAERGRLLSQLLASGTSAGAILEKGRLQWFAWWCIPVGVGVVIWQLAIR